MGTGGEHPPPPEPVLWPLFHSPQNGKILELCPLKYVNLIENKLKRGINVKIVIYTMELINMFLAPELGFCEPGRPATERDPPIKRSRGREG
jgi:hypothetical protein